MGIKNTFLKVYNADEVIVTVGTVIIDSGLADGEFLTIEQDTEDTEDVVGTDGEVAVSRTNDRRATATIKLLQTSSANDGLSALSALVKESPSMAGAFVPFHVQDLNGRSLFTASQCWVRKAPDRTFDRTAQSTEWEIRIAHLKRVDGGNNLAI